MTNGTGQFIRDYMFPKNTSNTIATISEQLDSYRQIKDKIEDLRKRIEILTDIQTSGQELVRLQSDKIQAEAMIRCIELKICGQEFRPRKRIKRSLQRNRSSCMER